MTSFKTAAMAGVCLALAAAAPAFAQTVNAFTTQNVIQMLSAMGIAGAEKGTVQGPDTSELVRFDANGLRHVAVLEVCNTGAAGCLGLHLLTVWNDVPGVDVNLLNEFNGAYSFAKAVGMGSTMGVARYVISDGGVSAKNVQENISNHVGLATTFVEFYRNASGASTVSLTAKDARPQAVQVRAAPGLEGLAPLLAPNDYNAASVNAAATTTHAVPR